MYRSTLDALGKLEFPFDPLRALHARSDSVLQWAEYPYKQVLIDRVRSKSAAKRTGDSDSATNTTISVEAAAGALLIALGEETRALFEIDQHRPRESDADNESTGWDVLARRFTDERAAFRAAKRAFLLEQKHKVERKLESIETRKRDDEAHEAHVAWKQRQIVKRFDDGSKYDGDGVCIDNVLVPHGVGTLYVPQKQQFLTESIGEIKRVPRYTGEWVDGFMHGQGTYYWPNGDAWVGYFLRNELEGKGVYTFANEQHSSIDTGDDADAGDADDCNDVDRRHASQSDAMLLREQVRYYSASQHVCWGHELVIGCRLLLLANRHNGHALATATASTGQINNDNAREGVLVAYNAANGTHQVRVSGTEDTKWLSLHNTRFRIVPGPPVTRFERQ